MNEEDQFDWWPPEEPLVSGLFPPGGDGVQIFVHSDEVYIACFWDGACQKLLHLEPEELDAICQVASHDRS